MLARSVRLVVDQPRIQLVAYAVAAVLLVIGAVKLLSPDRGGPSEAPVVLEGGRREATHGVAYVHVAGAVRRPGLKRVPRTARVALALERAGGPTRRADLTAVNLAARVQDGQQIVVPRAGAQPAGDPGEGVAGTASGGAGGRISLATATVEQLDTLDGIGPTLAKRIIDYRDEHGGFRSIDALREVEGIGEKRFASLKDAVRP